MSEPLTVKVELTDGLKDVLKDFLKAITIITEELKVMDARVQALELKDDKKY